MADDSSSDENVVAPPKARPVVDSDSSEDDPPARITPKATAVVKTEDSSSDDDEPVPKAKAKAVARPVVETDSEDDSPPARVVPKAAAKDSDSDSDDEVTVAPKAKPMVEDSSSDDEDEAAKATQKKQGKEQDVKAKAKLDAAVEEPKRNSTENTKQKGEDDTDDLRVIVKGIPFKVKEAEVRKCFSNCGGINHVKMLADEKGLSRGVACITFVTSAGVKEALQKNGDKEQYKGRTLSVERALKRPAANGDAPKKNKKQKQNKNHDGKVKSGEGGSSGSTADPSVIVNQEIIQKMLRLQEVKDFSSLEKMGAKIVKLAQSAQQLARDQQNARKKRFENTIFVKGLPVKDFNEEAFQRRFQDCGSIKFVWMPSKSDGENKGFGTISFKTEEAFEKALKYNGTKCGGNVLSVVKSERSKPKEGNKGEAGKVDKTGEGGNVDKKGEADVTSKQRSEAQVAERPAKRKMSSAEEVSSEVATKQAKKERKHAAEAPVEAPVEKKRKKDKAPK